MYGTTLSLLQELLLDVQANKGALRRKALRLLRLFLKNNTDENIIGHIKKLTDDRDFKILIEAGLRQSLLDAVTDRQIELDTRRGE